MPEPMAFIRALHYAATLLTTGSLVFWTFVVPAKRSLIVASRHRAWMVSGATLALLSAVLWLGGQAATFPPPPGVQNPGLALRALDILTDTIFGHAWTVRLVLLLALVLVVLGRPTRARLGGAVLLAIAATATLAYAGHAAAGDPLRRSSDMLHLTLAAVWLGGLLPLAALLRAASRNASAQALTDAQAVTRRFSNLGVASVGWLLATGLVNAWALVGSVPNLIGTPYGRLLTLKIFFFLSMGGLAAVNRQVLTPALEGAGPAARAAARRLGRNALVETLLGLLILADVGVLGISVPAGHDQINWPLPVTWSLAAVTGQPAWEFAAVVAAVLVVVGLTLAGSAALGHWHRGIGLSSGAGIALMGVVLGGMALSEPAVPTFYLNSPLPYSVTTVAAGAHTYGEQCVACHGPYGYGDGPAGAGLPVRPADLSRQHVGHHTDGMFFWWISHGKGGENAMPAFADLLDEQQRWEVIGFLHAQFDSETAQSFGPRINPALRVPAPDFAYERGGGGQQTLSMLREAWSVLLVLYTPPESEARLKSLAAAAKQLDLGGLRVVAVPLGEGVEKGPIFAPGDPDLVAAYELYRKHDSEAAPPDHLEYFIDAWGYLRARFTLADAPTPEQLVAMMEAVDREPPPPPVGAAAHTHSH